MQKWARRISFVFGLIVIALVVAWLVFASQASRRLQQATSTIRARGEPLYLEDYTSKYVIDESNLAIPLRAAIDAMKLDSKESREQWDALYAIEGAWTDEDRGKIDDFLSARPDVIPIVRNSRTLQRIEWNVPLQHLVDLNTTTPELQQIRSLGQFLGFAAIRAHENGKDAEAAELLTDLLRLSDAARSILPSRISDLTGSGIGALAICTLENILPEMEVRAASNQLGNVTSLLLDESVCQESNKNALIGERTLWMESLRKWKPGAIKAPWFDASTAVLLEAAEDVRASDGDTYPAAVKAMGKARTRIDAAALYTGVFASLAFNVEDLVARLHYGHRTERRMVAVAIAIRRYQADHAGQRPQNLDQLVPTYLTAIPIDLFSPDGQPLNYVPGENACVYSVGADGKDDAASTQPTNAKEKRPVQDSRWERADAVFYLDKRPDEMSND